MWKCVGILACVLAAACDASVAPRAEASGQLIAFGGGPGGAGDACFSCHGLKGEGMEDAPRLAGQTQGYLVKQLQDYAQERRTHPDMTKISARLGDTDRTAVSSYYANLASPTPMPSQAAAVAVGSGETLYLVGDQARGLKPCAECHGVRAEGVGQGNPALAGLTADYALKQLADFRDGTRRNDGRNQMGAVARELSEVEMASLAVYIATIAQ